nr:MAG TPA_asm: hyaluronidase [Caudoviricetes sp.]
MASQIQLRRDTAANWTSANPTLAQGEIGIETNTLKAKIGNGSTAWNSLAYFGDISTLNAVGDVTITSATTGQVLQWNGQEWVNATLDALPSQTGNDGKYLTTNGSTASWATITTDPTPNVFLLMGA